MYFNFENDIPRYRSICNDMNIGIWNDLIVNLRNDSNIENFCIKNDMQFNANIRLTPFYIVSSVVHCAWPHIALQSRTCIYHKYPLIHYNGASNKRIISFTQGMILNSKWYPKILQNLGIR